MLKPEIPPDQVEVIRPILEPLLDRLRSLAGKLPPLAESALAYVLPQDHREQGQ